jgi:hypothetical protein
MKWTTNYVGPRFSKPIFRGIILGCNAFQFNGSTYRLIFMLSLKLVSINFSPNFLLPWPIQEYIIVISIITIYCSEYHHQGKLQNRKLILCNTFFFWEIVGSKSDRNLFIIFMLDFHFYLKRIYCKCHPLI